MPPAYHDQSIFRNEISHYCKQVDASSKCRFDRVQRCAQFLKDNRFVLSAPVSKQVGLYQLTYEEISGSINMYFDMYYGILSCELDDLKLFYHRGILLQQNEKSLDRSHSLLFTVGIEKQVYIRAAKRKSTHAISFSSINKQFNSHGCSLRKYKSGDMCFLDLSGATLGLKRKRETIDVSSFEQTEVVDPLAKKFVPHSFSLFGEEQSQYPLLLTSGNGNSASQSSSLDIVNDPIFCQEFDDPDMLSFQAQWASFFDYHEVGSSNFSRERGPELTTEDVERLFSDTTRDDLESFEQSIAALCSC